ncbi:MAG TPA: hypothetical protein VK757_05075 [Candidatus Acidoferrum sp.]|nr:hypothetical protein [Candidatus Acidoferrum sp.]
MIIRQVAVLVAVAMLAGSLCAAWPQTSSKQRVEAFTKLPDWSGLWEYDIWVGQADGQQLSPEGMRKAKAYAAAMRPQFSPAWQPKYDEIRKAVEAAVAVDPTHPPVTHTPCIAPPFPATTLPGMYEWRVTPEETTLISTMGSVRHIYTDGRSHPPKDELWPTRMGDSVGHWEGDALVVDTVATRQQIYMGELSGFFVPMSDQLHFTERIRMVNHDEMEIYFRTEDRIALAKPIEVTLHYARVTDLNRMIDENECEDNDRDPVVNGRFITTAH